MQSNYPDYIRISEIEKELSKLAPRLEMERYFDEEAADLEDDLNKQLRGLVMGEQVEAEGKSCKEKYCRNFDIKGSAIYYPGKVHHLDGDINNESFGNLALVCPKCQAHILLSRFTPQDIWLLKTRGLSNAEIGRLLDLSRERVRQLCEKYEAEQRAKLKALIESDLDELVKKAEHIEDGLIASRRLKRRIDRRTKKKRIIAELNRLRTQGGAK